MTWHIAVGLLLGCSLMWHKARRCLTVSATQHPRAEQEQALDNIWGHSLPNFCLCCAKYTPPHARTAACIYRKRRCLYCSAGCLFRISRALSLFSVSLDILPQHQFLRCEGLHCRRGGAQLTCPTDKRWMDVYLSHFQCFATQLTAL